MKLLFRQRFFSWFDSYDIYAEDGTVAYTVEGKLSWGHLLKIYDRTGLEVGTVKQKVVTFLPKFELYRGEMYLGCIYKEFTLFRPRFTIDYRGWDVDGSFFEWDYYIVDQRRQEVAVISKELLHMTDTYVIDVRNPDDALDVLMLVLAIDAEKCSRG